MVAALTNHTSDRRLRDVLRDIVRQWKAEIITRHLPLKAALYTA